MLSFTETIAADSLTLAIWPHELNLEGEFMADSDPLVDGCTPAAAADCEDEGSWSECGGASICLAADGLTATIRLDDSWTTRLGKPYLIEVAPGLTDMAGRTKHVRARMQFILSPPLVVDDGSGDVPDPLPLEFNTGISTLSADLTHILDSIYLRLFMDVGFDPATGEADFLATVARLFPAEASTSVEPDARFPILDSEGWTVLIRGVISELEPGVFYMQTDPVDLIVHVLGFIRVELVNFTLEGTITPAGREDGRDVFEGLMRADQGYMGDPPDPVDLGKVDAVFFGYGLLEDELDDELIIDLPRLCESDPCEPLRLSGGDCQLTLPWQQPAWCADDRAADGTR